MTRLSDAAASGISLDAAALIAALRKLRRLPSRHVPALLDMLARQPAIARMEQEHGADGVTLRAKPARHLAMFLKRVRTCATGPLSRTRSENLCSF
jgi:hypothetical protein